MTPRRTISLPLAFTLLLAPLACAGDDPLDDENDAFPDGKTDGGIDEGSPEALGVLALVNDTAVDSRRARRRRRAHATARQEHRRPPRRRRRGRRHRRRRPVRHARRARRGSVRRPDALNALLEYAKREGPPGRRPGQRRASSSRRSRPQASHTARIAQIIDAGRSTRSTSRCTATPTPASQRRSSERPTRGVKVRFVFETANDRQEPDRRSALASSKSGRLEAAGVDVRWVNKIMHHKFADRRRSARRRGAGRDRDPRDRQRELVVQRRAASSTRTRSSSPARPSWRCVPARVRPPVEGTRATCVADPVARLRGRRPPTVERPGRSRPRRVLHLGELRRRRAARPLPHRQDEPGDGDAVGRRDPGRQAVDPHRVRPPAAARRSPRR